LTTPADHTPTGPDLESRHETSSNVARRTLLAATAVAVPTVTLLAASPALAASDSAVTLLAASPALAASETSTATLSPTTAQVADGDTQLFTLTVLSGNGKAFADVAVTLFVSSPASLPGFAVAVDGGGSAGLGGFLQVTTDKAGQVLLLVTCGRLTAEQGGSVTLNAGVSGIGATMATAEFRPGTITLAADVEKPPVSSTVKVSGTVAKPFGRGAYASVTSVKLSVPADSGAAVPASVPVSAGAFSADVAGPVEPKVISVTATDDYLVATLDISFLANVTGPETTWARGRWSTYLTFLTAAQATGSASSYYAKDINVDLQVPDYTTPRGQYYSERTWKRGVRGWRSKTNQGPNIVEAPGTWISGGEGMHFGLKLTESAMPYPSRSPVLPDDFPATINVRVRPGTGKWASSYLYILNCYHVGIVTSVGGQDVTTAREYDAPKIAPGEGWVSMDISSLLS
jgi:hypothetical protein